MVVITLEKCPASLRGDLTKWLQEISLGVYVGQVSARVRDNLWRRVCAEAKGGRATMVFSAQNEQHLDFRVHNTSWEPIDYDGLKLMLRPSPSRVGTARKEKVGYSDASRQRLVGHGRDKRRIEGIGEYVVVDLETSGLSVERDVIIEIAALKVVNGSEVDRFQSLVKTNAELTDEVTRLTGLSKCDLEDGEELDEVIESFLAFIGSSPLVMHNADFDMGFIDAALELFDIDELDNECIDTLTMARKRLPHLGSYGLDDLMRSFGIESVDRHRALGDCLTTKIVFERLLEL